MGPNNVSGGSLLKSIRLLAMVYFLFNNTWSLRINLIKIFTLFMCFYVGGSRGLKGLSRLSVCDLVGTRKAPLIFSRPNNQINF